MGTEDITVREKDVWTLMRKLSRSAYEDTKGFVRAAETLLEVVIRTGVTHQIRAQLAIAGMHIINDRLYGAFAVENQRGHCLHALSAAFLHPSSGAETEIRTQYPDWARI